MKKTYMAVTVERDGKRCAYVIGIRNGHDNAWDVLVAIPNLESVLILNSKKEAVDTVNCWNGTWKTENRYWNCDTRSYLWVY